LAYFFIPDLGNVRTNFGFFLPA